MNTDTHCNDTAATLDADITCVACDGNLRGAKLHDVCPHCGQPIGASIALETIRQTDLTVATDVSCVHCGYNLRTMPINSRCPECGHEVIDSLRSSELRYAPLNGLKGLRAAAIMLAVGHVAPIVVLGGLCVGAPVLGVGGSALALLLLGCGLMGISAPLATRHAEPSPWPPSAIIALLLIDGFLFVCGILAFSSLTISLSFLICGAAGILSLRTISGLGRRARNETVLRAAKVSTALLALWMLLAAILIGLLAVHALWTPAPLNAMTSLIGYQAPCCQVLLVLLGLLTYVATLTTSLACVSMLTQTIRAHNSATKPIE
ncbi:MAG: hypothetical protein GXY55_12045 [Phycisphaerae bacterium]|nr:hypothetical protein [Phycisphaerae bacterium]